MTPRESDDAESAPPLSVVVATAQPSPELRLIAGNLSCPSESSSKLR